MNTIMSDHRSVLGVDVVGSRLQERSTSSVCGTWGGENNWMGSERLLMGAAVKVAIILIKSSLHYDKTTW
jgi:hypothetical protein